MKKGEKFEITYKSIGDTERREIESIRSRYMGASESDDKIVRLQRLDFLVRKLPIFILNHFLSFVNLHSISFLSLLQYFLSILQIPFYPIDH